MSDAIQAAEAVAPEATDALETPASIAAAPPATETADQKVARLEADAAKSAELIAKLRRFEKENKAAAERATGEAATLTKKLEDESARRLALEDKVRGKAIDSALEQALVAAGAKAPKTAAKLIDRDKVEFDGETEAVNAESLAKIVAALAESDPILFADKAEATPATPAPTAHPPVRKAIEGEVVGGYEKEIAGARNQKEIETVLRKYGKMG